MLYIPLILLLLTLVATVAGLVYAYKKLPGRPFILLVLLLIAVPLVTIKMYEHNFMLSVVPDALDVSSISYRKEESWGFGPGGNEAGIRLYPMTGHIAKQVQNGGINFLKNMPPNKNQNGRRWRGYYSNWIETPIKPGPQWEPTKEDGKFDTYSYVCRYGFCIDIEEDVVKEVNSIANTPGSYYAYGRIGLIIVSPHKKKVIYLYNG
jgi:hypothetical protein